MEKEKMESLLIDYIDGKLNDADRSFIEQQLIQNPEAKKLHDQLRTVLSALDATGELEPVTRLKDSFNQILQEEIRKNTPTRSLFFQPVIYRAAAVAALVMAGVAIGFWINNNNQREVELLALRKEVEATKQIMLVMLNNQESASQRMVGANVAYKIEKADDEIVRALAKTMNEDQNTNVRLAALEALFKFHEDPQVRKVLISSLSGQTDPMVQITLIQFLVKMKEKEVVPQLQDIVKDARTLKAVKDEAYVGLFKLS
jgi:hypothetical protein